MQQYQMGAECFECLKLFSASLDHSFALRMLLLSWLFLSITMDSAYCAALTSVLTSVYAPIKNMFHLNQSSQIKIVGQSGSGLVTSIFGVFENKNIPCIFKTTVCLNQHHQNIFLYVKDRIPYMDPIEATQLVLLKNYAYVGYLNSLKESIKDMDPKIQRICFDINQVRVSPSVAYGGFLTRKQSQYTPFFKSK